MSYATITVDQLKSRLQAGEKPFLIDVREDEEVAAGMIDGALHIPMGEIPNRLGDIPSDSEVIFVCRSGGRSGRVCDYLAAQGYDNVVNMLGGMLAWEYED